MLLLYVIMADQVHQHRLRLMGQANKGRGDRGIRCERQAGAPRVHRRLQNFLSMLPSMVDHAPPNKAARKRLIVVLPLSWSRIAGRCRGHAFIILRMITIINNESEKIKGIARGVSAGREKKKHALRRALLGTNGGGYF